MSNQRSYRWLQNVSDVEESVWSLDSVCLKDRQRNVIHGNPGRGLAVGRAVMRMSVHHEICAHAVDDLTQPRISEVGIDLHGLAFDRFDYGRVVQHHDAALGAQLRHGAL